MMYATTHALHTLLAKTQPKTFPKLLTFPAPLIVFIGFRFVVLYRLSFNGFRNCLRLDFHGFVNLGTQNHMCLGWGRTCFSLRRARNAHENMRRSLAGRQGAAPKRRRTHGDKDSSSRHNAWNDHRIRVDGRSGGRPTRGSSL